VAREKRPASGSAQGAATKNASQGLRLIRGHKPPLARFDSDRRAAQRAKLRLLRGGVASEGKGLRTGDEETDNE
jgi:hypothetical protein